MRFSKNVLQTITIMRKQSVINLDLQPHLYCFSPFTNSGSNHSHNHHHYMHRPSILHEHHHRRESTTPSDSGALYEKRGLFRDKCPSQHEPDRGRKAQRGKTRTARKDAILRNETDRESETRPMHRSEREWQDAGPPQEGKRRRERERDEGTQPNDATTDHPEQVLNGSGKKSSPRRAGQQKCLPKWHYIFRDV